MKKLSNKTKALIFFIICVILAGLALSLKVSAQVVDNEVVNEEELINADEITFEAECEYWYDWSENLNNIACNEPERMINIYIEADSYVREDIGEYLETATDEEYFEFIGEYNALLEYLATQI